jgi:phytoene dehydrogenase-like protein
MLVLTTTGDAPPGGQAWTIQRRGRAAGDVLDALAVRGIDVRSKLVTRRDLTPAGFGEAFGRSAYGLRWDRPRAYARRCAQQHPLTGLYLIGSSTHPGASMSYAAWGAAHAATLIGKPA